MRKTATVAVVLIAMCGPVIGAGGGIASASSASRPPAVARPGAASLSRYVVALEFCSLRSQRLCAMTLDSRFNVTAEGPDLWATNMRWYRWNTREAKGTGVLWAADSIKWRAGRVTIVLSRPRKYVTVGGRRHAYFTRAHIIGGRGVAGYWHWIWTSRTRGTWEG